MKTVQIVALMCVGLAAGASGLRAQSGLKQANDASSKDAAKMMARRPVTHGRMEKLQRAAIAAAEQAEQLSRARKLDRQRIVRDAETARTDLETVEKHLADAEQHATGTEKQHFAGVRAHEQQAVTHANELVRAAEGSSKPDAAAVSTHAKAVIEHAQAAEKLMATVTATDDWQNR